MTNVAAWLHSSGSVFLTFYLPIYLSHRMTIASLLAAWKLFILHKFLYSFCMYIFLADSALRCYSCLQLMLQDVCMYVRNDGEILLQVLFSFTTTCYIQVDVHLLNKRCGIFQLLVWMRAPRFFAGMLLCYLQIGGDDDMVRWCGGRCWILRDGGHALLLHGAIVLVVIAIVTCFC